MIDKRIQDDDSQDTGSIETYRLKLLLEFERLLNRVGACFGQERTRERAKTLASAMLCSEPPHTITNWIMAAGLEDRDWTEHYRFFSEGSWSAESIFDVVMEETFRFTGNHFYAAMDEVHLPKSGRKIPGVRTLRDPLGLRFANPLHRAQRWLNTVCLVPWAGDAKGPARGVPIDFRLVTPAKKPGKNASEEQIRQYKFESEEKSISVQGAKALQQLRWRLDRMGKQDALIMMSLDGSFTNGKVLLNLPDRTVVVGRTGKNIGLYSPAPAYAGIGRRRKYGARLGTPEEIRKDVGIAWQKVKIWACGRDHDLEYKTISPVLWQGGTKDKPLRLIVIRPLSYRLTKKSKLLYSEPAYLLVSDTEMSVEEVLQCYFYRWEIEVNHRDMKSIIGIGDAQVRNVNSSEKVPQFAAAVYSLMLLASNLAYGQEREDVYERHAKWRNDIRPRPSTLDIIRRYRRELDQAGIMSFRPLASQCFTHKTAENSIRQQAMWHQEAVPRML